MSMNKVILIGNIATEIELKATPNGNYVANFNLAVNEYNGETTFIPIETWKKQAENVANYCGKGSKVAIEGSVKVDKWEKDGQKRSFTKINAFNIQFLDSKNSKSGQKSNSPEKQDTSNQSYRFRLHKQINAHNNEVNKTLQNEGEQLDITDDDLPF